jgi:hypothetical protein
VSIRSADKKIPAHERLENRAARFWVHSPQPLRLLGGELKAWHLQVLAFDASYQKLVGRMFHGERQILI